jgi:aryl-alcohol dehydrogenase-like predicted oxidoreductase
MTLGMTQQLALGTAQFGLDYGITNTRGRVPQAEAEALLKQAWQGGIRILDTAQAYGNSEEVLGAAIRDAWRVVTKTLPLRSDRVDEDALARVDAAFTQSQRLLGKVDTLLVHHAQDLFVPGGERLFAWLADRKARGDVSRIGVSVYDGREIAALLDRFTLDVVQLPANIADQRLVIDGSIARLHAAGVEIHVRSLFLQGLLLADPKFAAERFPERRYWFDEFHAECAKQGVSPQAACFGFFKSHPEFNVAVVGVSSAQELAQLQAAWAGASAVDWSAWGVDNTSFTDPRLWKPRA